MNVLNVSHIQKSYGVNCILNDISFSLQKGDRVGLIGRNGAGKTTLFKILTRQIDADSGSVSTVNSLKVGYLEQQNTTTTHSLLLDYCVEVFKDLIDHENLLKSMELQIQTADHNDPAFNTLLETYHHEIESFENNGGYTYISRTQGVLKGLSFNDSDFKRPVDSLSGGQLTRLNIAKLLLTEPDILLLDEPTNHLDISAVQWLENYLKQYPGTLLIITHDRFFLDQVTNKIIEIEYGQTLSHLGNYSAFQEFKRKNKEIQQRAYEKQEAEFARQEEIIKRFKQHGTEKLAKRARSREKRLEQMSRSETPSEELKHFRLQFEISSPSGHDVLLCRDLSFGFTESPLFTNLNFDLYKGEKVGLIGPNGIGKTTLFKLILKTLTQWNGDISTGHNVSIKHYDQNLKFEDSSYTLINELANHRPDLNDTRLRSYLGAFLFSGDDAFKPISTLSGGEKARLSLLKLLLDSGNFLLMDEPTNHLDIAAREVLEDALIHYEGSLLLISHDRYFLDRVCTKIIDLTPESATEYLGNYSYFIHKQAENALLEMPEQESITKTQIKNQRRKEKEQELSMRTLKKEVKDLEEKIASLEQEIEALNIELCKEEIYSNPDNIKTVRHQLNVIETQLEHVYSEWTEKLDQISINSL